MNRKHILLLSLPILALLATVLLGGFLASRAEYGNEFNVVDSTLVKYVGTDSEVVIPSGITTIGREAFAGNTVITSVSFPDSVNYIEHSAFSGCTALETVHLPDRILAIEDSAFYGCESLREFSVGKDLESLGSGVFADCISLENVVISSENKNFVCEDGAIYDINRTTLYQYLPGAKASDYKMPDTVEDVLRYSFWGCHNLRNVLLSSGLEEIPDYSFTNCHSLELLTLYSPIGEIGLKALENRSSLKQIVVPISVISIHDSAFDLCPNTLLFVCDSGTYAENYALEHGFSVGTELAYDNLWNEDEVSDDTQEDNAMAEEETAQDGNDATPDAEGVLIDHSYIVSDRAYVDVANLSVCNGVALPETENGVAIDDYAFYNRTDMQEYTSWESGLSHIGVLSFARSGLVRVIIPEGVTTIGYGAFYHCDALTNVSIPSTVTRVGRYALTHTAWYNNWLNDESTSDFLIVGNGVLIAYKGEEPVVTIPSEVLYIEDYVFEGHYEIDEVILPTHLEGADIVLP